MSQILSFAFIALGLSLSGYFLGSGLQFFKTGFQRSVTVKGIAQKTVESDILKVDIRFWETGSEALSLRKKAADEFAKASGVKIGKISKAQQGRFTITSPSASDEYDPNEAYSKAKKVRVISNVTFDLE